MIKNHINLLRQIKDKPMEDWARKLKAYEVKDEHPSLPIGWYYEMDDAIEALKQAYAQGKKEGLEEAAKIAEEHYEDHCCEDCPCSYWRKNVAQQIRRLK